MRLFRYKKERKLETNEIETIKMHFTKMPLTLPTGTMIYHGSHEVVKSPMDFMYYGIPKACGIFFAFPDTPSDQEMFLNHYEVTEDITLIDGSRFTNRDPKPKKLIKAIKKQKVDGSINPIYSKNDNDFLLDDCMYEILLSDTSKIKFVGSEKLKPDDRINSLSEMTYCAGFSLKE